MEEQKEIRLRELEEQIRNSENSYSKVETKIINYLLKILDKTMKIFL